MSSNRDINSKLGDVMIAQTDIVSRLQAASGTTSSELERVQIAVRSLQSDAGMATSVSQSFNHSSAA